MFRYSVLFAVALTACGGAFNYDYKSEPDPRRSEFQVNPLDQLSVVVWKNRELSADVVVRPDGIVTLPLIGDVHAAGRTTSDLQKEITKRFGEYVRDEQVVVSVAVSQVNSYYFTVSGNVEKSGVYTSKAYVTTVEAVAMAGGPNKFAGDAVWIVRGTPPRRIPIDLPRGLSGTNPESNLTVLRGDVIFIP